MDGGVNRGGDAGLEPGDRRFRRVDEPALLRLFFFRARMVKLVDTLGSGSSGRKAVLVQVQFRAK
jgi:hypothetical protein